jgi:hypothetical protein
MSFQARVAGDGLFTKRQLIWPIKLRILFAFGTIVTRRKRRGFMPILFRIRPWARCTAL